VEFWLETNHFQQFDLFRRRELSNGVRTPSGMRLDFISSDSRIGIEEGNLLD
jgi:hypothetical protein